MSVDLIEKVFDLYSNKTESDYWIIHNGERVPTMCPIVTYDDEDNGVILKLSDKIIIYTPEFINALSPDNIDSNYFWKVATNKFPLFSIGGGILNIKTINELNHISSDMAFKLGVIKPIEILLNHNRNARILEIGSGHGNFQKILEHSSFGDSNYYAIDVNPLFSHPRIFQTNGKSIPSDIPYPLDAVYSMNVFQHLSKTQRTSYYKQIYVSLKEGGIFVFGMFVITKNNRTKTLWGMRDHNDNFYCHFFRQLTIIDTEEDIKRELNNIGFSVENLSPLEEDVHYLTFKCTKIND